MDLTVVVATFGAQEWQELAKTRAVPSAEAQTQVVQVHGATLHDARNQGLALVETEWVVFLDADDELEPGYVEALAQGTADLRAPAVRYVSSTTWRSPRMPRVAGHRHDCTADCLPDGNWLVVGTAVRTDLVCEVGGWRDWACYEDWDLWLRCWQAGATIEAIPDAIYRAHVRPDSRNRAPAMELKNRVHRAIVAANFGEEVAA